MKTNLKRLVCCAFALLGFVFATALVPAPAHAESIDQPTEEELAACAEDGMLEEHVACRESLDAPPSDELRAHRRHRPFRVGQR